MLNELKRKIKVIKKQRRHTNNFFLKVLFYFKDFISISVKCIFWQLKNEIVENQDLYSKKDDFWKMNKIKNLFFNVKVFFYFLLS